MGISSVESSVIRKVAFRVFKVEQLHMTNNVTSFQLTLTFTLPVEQGLSKVRQISLVTDKYFMAKLCSELWQLVAAFGKCKVIPQHHFKCLHS